MQCNDMKCMSIFDSFHVLTWTRSTKPLASKFEGDVAGTQPKVWVEVYEISTLSNRDFGFNIWS